MARIRTVFMVAVVGVGGVGSGCTDDDPVEIEFFVGDAETAAYRLSGGPWQKAMGDATGKHTLVVNDDYEYAVITTYGSYAYTWVTRATAADTRATRAARGGAGEEVDCSDATVTVTGSLAQAGMVSMAGTSDNLIAADMFTLDVPPGTHDLVATTNTASATGPRSIAIRRDQVIQAATTLPPLDITAEGAPLVPTPISVVGASSPTTSVYLTTDGEYFAEISSRSEPIADLVPSSLLRPTDEQHIYVQSTLSGADIRYTGTGTLPALMLPPALTNVTFNKSSSVAAGWSNLPVDDYSYVQLVINGLGSAGSFQVLHYVSATRGWIEKNGATTIEVPSDIPGVQAAWQLDATQPYDATATVYQIDGNVSLWSGAAMTGP